MLNAYRLAKKVEVDRPTNFGHGKLAEASFRQWLESFLPKRFGVTSGYIISQGQQSGKPIYHFDVIIYDQIESPILWVVGDSDQSGQGKSKAIPAEHVLCVIEVKSTFSRKSVQESVRQLGKLKHLMKNFNVDGEHYPENLPETFSCMIVFFELLKRNAKDYSALEDIVKTDGLRGFHGALILSGSDTKANCSGRLHRLRIANNHPYIGAITKSMDGELGLLADTTTTDVLLSDCENSYHGVLIWAEHCFAQFAHDIIAMCKGRYSQGRLSSYHGIRFRT